MQKGSFTTNSTAAVPVRTCLTILDIDTDRTDRYPVVVGGLIRATHESLYIAIPGVFWRGARFKVDYTSLNGPVTVYAAVSWIDWESEDGTQRIGHILNPIPMPLEVRAADPKQALAKAVTKSKR